MFLVARPNHGSIEERHTRHERRYSPAVRSSISCTQEIEHRVRRRTALVGCGRACAARRREEARACPAPPMARLEKSPSKSEIARLVGAPVDGFCESYRRAPSSITLDIDDTCDTVHGHQQLSLFNAHYDERCFLPIHIYDEIG